MTEHIEIAIDVNEVNGKVLESIIGAALSIVVDLDDSDIPQWKVRVREELESDKRYFLHKTWESD